MVRICWCKKYSRCCWSISIRVFDCTSLRKVRRCKSIFKYFKIAVARSFSSSISNTPCFSKTVAFILDDIKLMRNDVLSIFLIAKAASEGIFGFSCTILIERSLTASIVASNSLSFASGFTSGISFIIALMYGFSSTILSISKRFLP